MQLPTPEELVSKTVCSNSRQSTLSSTPFWISLNWLFRTREKKLKYIFSIFVIFKNLWEKRKVYIVHILYIRYIIVYFFNRLQTCKTEKSHQYPTNLYLYLYIYTHTYTNRLENYFLTTLQAYSPKLRAQMETAPGVWKQILRQQLQTGAAGLKPPKGRLSAECWGNDAVGPNEGELCNHSSPHVSLLCCTIVSQLPRSDSGKQRENAVLTALSVTWSAAPWCVDV